MPSPRVAFISGPTDATQSYFQRHYAPQINTAITRGDSFVLGPVDGIDALSLSHLLASGIPKSRITVYMAHFEYQMSYLRAQFEECGVRIRVVGDRGSGTMTRDRDAMMTEESDYDILRYRTEGEAKAFYDERWRPRVSNTELNERRRAGIESMEYTLGGAGEGGGGKGSLDGVQEERRAERKGL